MTSSKKPIALVTGANRGLGLETCRQLARKGYQVLLGSRDETKGQAAAKKLQNEDLDVTELLIDVESAESIEQAVARIQREHERLDALVNNAGVFLDNTRDNASPDNEDISTSALEVPIEIIKKTIATNVFGAYQLIQKLAPLMIETAKQSGAHCCVVNVSSGMGQLSEMNGAYPGYRISKTALNAVTRIFSEELAGHRIFVNSVCPGWVKTDMGGPGAELTPEQGADTIVWAATLADDGPTGGFFRERKRIDW